MKKCSRCEIDKSLTDFRKNKKSNDGYTGVCKVCLSSSDKILYHASPRTPRPDDDHTRFQECRICKVTKAHSEFPWYSQRGIPRSYCKTCDVDQQRFVKYGLTPNDYSLLLSQQRSCCKACKDPLGYKQHDRAIDHCHRTGVVRGILCKHCNLALGHLRDDPIRINKLLEYLNGTS